MFAFVALGIMGACAFYLGRAFSSAVPRGSIQQGDANEVVYWMEHGRRVSESGLWQISRDSYMRRGPKAWTSGDVPTWITTGAHMAKMYASLVLKFALLACGDGEFQCDVGTPLYIVELGSGHGKLGFLILKHLESMRAELRSQKIGIELPRFVFVMTDAVRDNIRSLQANAWLKPFVDAAELDFAVFDCEDPGM